MPDWPELVRQRLSCLALDSAEKEEVQAELAAHLEESYEAFRAEGLPECEAFQRTLPQFSDWKALQGKIHAARNGEDSMTNRVKQFWLPSLLTLLSSMGLLMLIEFFGPNPWVIPPEHRRGWLVIAPAAVVYLPWLLSLPVIGAIGAYLSIRAGGARREAFTSIIFPVLPYSVIFIIGLPMIAILDDHVAHNIMFSALFVGLFAWVLAPGAALLTGGLLAQIFLSRRLGSRSITTG